MEPSVLAILTNVVDFMQKEGVTRVAVTFQVDENLINEIYEASRHQYSISELQKAVDKCVAHDWIEHRSIGEKYSYLGITEKGVGIVRSIRKQDFDRKNRKLLKKISDGIEDHKGLMVFLGLVATLATLLIKIYSGK